MQGMYIIYGFFSFTEPIVWPLPLRYTYLRADLTECGAEATKGNPHTCLTSDTELPLGTATSAAASANHIRVDLV